MNFYQQLKTDIGGAFKRIVVGQFSETLQQYLDCTINPYIKKKLTIQDVMSGQKQTDFDVDVINQKLGTNIVQNAYIKNIKMNNLQIMIDEIYIELNCAQQVKYSDVERIVQQSKQNEQKEKERQNLRRSIFQQRENSSQQLIQEVQPKQKKVQQILKFINLVFGNTEIEIKNIQIKVIWSIIGQQRYIDLNITNIVTKLQEHPESSKQLIVASIDQFKMNSQQRLISQMKKVLSAQIYIDNKEKPKINIEMGLLQFIIDGFELSCLFDLIQQVYKSRADYDRFYQQLIQKERNLNTIKIIKVEQQEQIVYQENYLEQSVMLDIDNYERGRYSQVDEIDQVLLKSISMSVHCDFFGYGLSVLTQRDNLHAVFDGINIIISQENLYECGQKIFSDHRFNKHCGNHFVFDINKITCNQNFQNNNTDIQILKISLYEIIQETNFQNKLQASSENEEFYSISQGSQSFQDCKGEVFSVARTILVLGNTIKEKFIRVDQQKFFIQEQNLMPSKVSQALHIKIKDDIIKVNISPINVILNFQLLNIFNYLMTQLSDKNYQAQNQPIQPIVISKNIQIDASFKLNFIPILLDLEYYQYNPDTQYKSYSIQSDKILLRMKFIEEKFENLINISIKSIQSENLLDIQNATCDIVIKKMEDLQQFEQKSSKVRISQLKHLKQTQNVFLNLNIPKIIVQQSQFQDIMYDFIKGKTTSLVYQYESELFQSINLAKQKSSNQSIIKPIKFIHIDAQVQSFLVETDNAIKIEIKQIQFIQTYLQQIILVKAIEIQDKSFVMEQNYQNILLQNLDNSKYVIKGVLDQYIKIQNMRIRLCNFQFLFMNYYQPIIKILQNLKSNNYQPPPVVEQSEPISITLKSILLDVIPSKFKTQSEQVRVQLFLSRLNYENNNIKLNEISGYIIKQIQEYDLLEIMTQNKFLQLTGLDITIKENIYEQTINLLLQNLQIFNASLSLFTQFKRCIELITEQLTEQQWFIKLTHNEQQQEQTQVIKKVNKNTKIQIQVDKIQLADPKNLIHVNIHVLNIDIPQINQFKIILQRLEILDNFPESRFKYLLDQDTNEAYFQQFDQKQQIRLDVDNYLEAEIKLDQDKISINYNIFPTRLFLTGFFLEYLQNSLLKDPDQFDDFEIIEDNAQREIEESLQQQLPQEQQSKKQFTIIGNSLLFILNFDSKGIKSDQFLKRFIKLGNLNDFYLQSKVIDIRNCKQDELSKQIIQQFGSPLDLTFEAYNSLEILTCVSALTQGIQSLFDKPFKNGVNGAVEGLQDFLVGVSTSALKLTSIPASVLNAITSKIGIGRPLWSINKVCDKLIDKINPQIPPRFIKK